MIDERIEIRPGHFCQFLLRTLEAAEGQTKRRKRDQTPDRIGLSIRRELLEQATADDPAPDAFEGWLMARVLAAGAGGPVRAMCAQILDEYRLVRAQPQFSAWLAAGAPSDDADDGAPVNTNATGQRDGRRKHFEFGDEHWCPICASDYVRDV